MRGLVVGGAAYAAGRAGARRAADEQEQNRAVADLRAGQAPPIGGTDVATKLTQLGAMVRQGLLTPEEFAAAKALLLG